MKFGKFPPGDKNKQKDLRAEEEPLPGIGNVAPGDSRKSDSFDALIPDIEKADVTFRKNAGPAVWDSSFTTGRGGEFGKQARAEKEKKTQSKDLRKNDAALPGIDAGSLDTFRDEQRHVPVLPGHESDESGTFGNSSESREEKKLELARAISQVQTTLAEKAGVSVEREAMLSAETAYLTAYRDFYAKNNKLQRLGKSVLREQGAKDLTSLKNVYDEAKFKYKDALLESVEGRTGRIDRATEEQSAKYQARTVRILTGRYEKLKSQGHPSLFYNDGTQVSLNEYINEQFEDQVAGDRYEKFLERYSRMVAFRDITQHGMEKKIEAREHALDAKGRNVFEKGTGWLLTTNQQVNKTIEGWIRTRIEGKKIFGKEVSEKTAILIAKNGARAARLIATSALVTGGVAVGGAGVAAVGLFGLQRLSLGALSMFGGAGIGAATGKIYDQTAGRVLSGLGKSGKKNLLFAESKGALRLMESNIRRGRKESIEKQRSRVELLATVLASRGISMEAADLISMQSAAEDLHTISTGTHVDTESVPQSTHPQFSNAPLHASPSDENLPKMQHEADFQGWQKLHPNSPPSHYPGDARAEQEIIKAQNPPPEDSLVKHSETGTPSDNSTETSPGNADTQPDTQTDTAPDSPLHSDSAASVPAENHAAFHTEIRAKGEGVNQLWVNLKYDLEEKYSLTDPNLPPAIKHILETKVSKLSEEYGFLKGGNGWMHDGDSISVTDDKITFTPSHGEAITLAHVDEKGAFVPQDSFTGGHQSADIEAAKTSTPIESKPAPTHATEPAATKIPEPVPRPTAPGLIPEHGDADSSALNKWILEHPGKTPPADLLHPAETLSAKAEIDSNKSTVESLHTDSAEQTANQTIGETYTAYKDMPMEKLLEPSAGIPSPLHDRLMDMIRRTGVGPQVVAGHQETIVEYLNRAISAHSARTGFAEGIHGLKVPFGETHVYMGPHDTPVVFGGDDQARMYAMGDYFMNHPNAKMVLMETYDTDGSPRTIPWTLVGGRPTPGAPLRDTFLGFGGLADGPNPRHFRSLIS